MNSRLILIGLACILPLAAQDHRALDLPVLAKNAILFVGDGMGISTVTAARIHSVGVDGKLTLDQLPYTALSRTYSGDYMTADSAATMSSMITGQKGNQGVISMDATTERSDFNRDGDGKPTTTLLELAKKSGRAIGVITTDSITGATPACTFAHQNERLLAEPLPLQALPTDPLFNAALGTGLDLLAGGGRGYFVPSTQLDDEGDPGLRSDGRDLRLEFQQAGYSYVWNRQQWNNQKQLPVLALFDNAAMDFIHSRNFDVGGNPSLVEMTRQAIRLLATHPQGFVLVIESGRIDHAHHSNNAWRAVQETEELDRAVAVAIAAVDLKDSLILVTADHSHVFNLAGYPLRPQHDLPYPTRPPATETPHDVPGNLFGVSWFIDGTGRAVVARDAFGQPYTALVYGNGPGYRFGQRTDPFRDPRWGIFGRKVSGPNHPNYMQETAVPLFTETHGGEDVAIWAIGVGSSDVHGSVDNTFVFDVLRQNLGL